MTYLCILPLKLPSANDYIRACRQNKYAASKFKAQYENDISIYIQKLPEFDKPVSIHFHWIEGNKRRDLDNVAFAKKFILDALVKCGKLKDDNRHNVTSFIDTFEYDKDFKIILEITEEE
jgi:Holliday junction resolvase RusA-like endonuclease